MDNDVTMSYPVALSFKQPRHTVLLTLWEHLYTPCIASIDNYSLIVAKLRIFRFFCKTRSWFCKNSDNNSFYLPKNVHNR